MEERSIRFNEHMVIATLAGLKTQARVVIKPQPPKWACDFVNKTQLQQLFQWTEAEQTPPRKLRRWPEDHYLRSPYSFPYRRLWVKETWAPDQIIAMPGTEIFYKADGWDYGPPVLWKSSVHMPRWASRITLDIVEVQAEKLQNISTEDIQAEGFGCLTKDGALYKYGLTDLEGYPASDFPWVDWDKDPRNVYARVWDSYTNEKYSWRTNPWVWKILFKRVENNHERKSTAS